MSALTWTAETVPSAKAIYGCTVAPSLVGGTIVLYGDDTTAAHRYVLTSTDGHLWTKTTIVDHGFYNMVWCSGFNGASGFFIACGYNGSTGDGIILSSPDATTWTIRKTIAGINGMFGLAYSPELNRVVCGGETGHLYYSDNGTSWTDVTVGGTATFQNMGWAPGLRAPVGSGLTTGAGVFAGFTTTSKEIYVSTDGITWAHSTLTGPDQRSGTSFSAQRLTWVPRYGKFFGDTGLYSGKINVSTDGLNWTTQNIPVEAVADFAWSGTALVAVGITAGGAGTSIYSVDGLTWTAQSVTATGPVDRIIWGGSVLRIFIASKVHTLADTITTAFTGPFVLSWWTLTLPGIGGVMWQQALTPPTDFILPYDVFSNGTFYLRGTTISWVVSVSTPSSTGWVFSLDAFSGAAYLVNSDSRPEPPRGYTEIATFATGSAGVFGGFPGVATGFNNRLVYVPGGYTVGTDSPTIRIYDGLFDRPIATVPNTSAGAVPKAVLSTLTANGLVYFSTFDSGTSSADWVGRVFSLDIESGKVTQVGGALTTGHLPYALCWHAGRLWCGSHRQSSAASGKVFYIRPGIDSDWTADHDVTSEGMASVTALWSFQGKLYVGTSAAAASFAKVLERDTAGAYTTSLTLSGGTAAANNAVLSMTDFGGNLYVGYYNADTGAVASIRKFTGSAWSSVYSGSGETVVPYVALFTDLTSMFAIGGGVGKVLIVLKTTDGSTWTDETIFVPDATSTGVPAFGVVVH